jgi:transcriptional antiterminator RfaH
MRWYVVSTRPHQETRAALNLTRQGFDVWLPQVRKTRRHARRIEEAIGPLFPGYLFVAFDSSRQPWHSINGTCGVRRLICQEDQPIRVPDSLITELQGRREADGYFIATKSAWLPGSKVRFLEGPFADCVATILNLSDGERVLLLLDILGRPVTTMARQGIIAAA